MYHKIYESQVYVLCVARAQAQISHVCLYFVSRVLRHKSHTFVCTLCRACSGTNLTRLCVLCVARAQAQISHVCVYFVSRVLRHKSHTFVCTLCRACSGTSLTRLCVLCVARAQANSLALERKQLGDLQHERREQLRQVRMCAAWGIVCLLYK